MVYYCKFGSPSVEFSDQNIQLYSLRKSAEAWNDLVNWVENREELDKAKDRMVFILNCFGLSLAQLLGQNDPVDSNFRYPIDILKDILDYAAFDSAKKRDLETTFSDFNKFYNAAHHFGSPKYRKIDELTIEKLNNFRRMVIDIWDAVCGLHDANGSQHSVSEVIIFKDFS